MSPETAFGLAAVEAHKLYDGDVDAETGATVDDWGYSECQRGAFIAGAAFSYDLMADEAHTAYRRGFDEGFAAGYADRSAELADFPLGPND